MAGDLQVSFTGWGEALGAGDLDAFYGAIDEAAVIYDEDIPFRLDKASFVDHIGFHASGLWESFAWVPREVKFTEHGDCGIVSGFATFRGKPKDAGFRQRHMGFSQTWVKKGAAWKLVCWHQGPLHGQIEGASPG
ncbi:MAG: nuclear transport factor 2 family protein [Pseudomonadota bacterium]